MKKIINFFKTLIHGIIPAITGGVIVLDIMYIINNIKLINTGNGWFVILFFTLAIIEFIVGIYLLYELGVIKINSNQWIKYNKELANNIINNDSEDSKNSNESTNVSSDN